ncbi:HK97 gp10 family phage protein [Defluviitalea raffinosedens]|uniref:HK97 gp10 family phage protein n=1 Tax=Defluviitalea raffinosedens TaxID=1450156 RepID=A0A7C8HE94_9FIRM|nr:HK97 gp10 family phage protein [Defluviitalea raffinosedens]KAE9633720.1 HK97 gp10 family phage protein [Defluviitalea raffinosedens]
MPKWGKVDYKQFKNLQQKIEKLSKADMNQFNEKMIKELAARMLAKVIKRTPVGQYPAETGKKGGTLRRGWTIGQVVKKGNTFEIEVINSVNYASYVEYGHRTRDHKGWVNGRFMMTISEQELEEDAPKIIEKKLTKYLGEVFSDDKP